MMLDRRQHGQSLVEFALIATLLLTMLLGMVDFALAYYSQVVIKNAVAEGGYYAIQHPGDTAGIEAAIDKELLANRQFIQKNSVVVTACVDDGVGGKKTTIQATYTHNMLFSYLVPSMQVTLKSQTEVPQLGCSSAIIFCIKSRGLGTMRRFYVQRNEGQAVVLAALAFIVMIGALGLALDGANAYNQRRNANNAADAAAMAGTRALLDGNKSGSGKNRDVFLAVKAYLDSHLPASSGTLTWNAYYIDRNGNQIGGAIPDDTNPVWK